MQSLDVPTLLTVTLLFNVMAICAWLLLGELFRMAPVACRLFAAALALRTLALGFPVYWAALPPLLRLGIVETGALLGSTLTLLGLRQLLGSRSATRPLYWVAGGALAVIVLGAFTGPPRLPALGSALGSSVLLVLALRELWRGLSPRLPRALVVGMALPFVAALLLSGLRTVQLGVAPWVDTMLLQMQEPPPPRALAVLVLNILITLTLMALLVWRLITRIQHLTRNDPLTGAANRRAFEARLAEAQALLRRGQGFALVMIDIDHFKRVNDIHGHAAGDAALRHCVRLWRPLLREVDAFGRVGGEEFCALLPLPAPDGISMVMAVAERLRVALAASPLSWQGQMLTLTASFGVAVPRPDDADGGLAAADAALYRAKAEGRNCVRADGCAVEVG